MTIKYFVYYPRRHGKKKNDKLCHWFADYFENISGEGADIHLSEFKAALNDQTVCIISIAHKVCFAMHAEGLPISAWTAYLML